MSSLPDPRLGIAPLLYIVGSGRSGSTLVERILAEVDGFVSIGESYALWTSLLRGDMRCGCGRILAGCPFWRAVLEVAGLDRSPGAMRERQLVVRQLLSIRRMNRLLAPRFHPEWRRRFHRLRVEQQRLYRAVTEVSGARVIIDGSKSVPLLLLLEQSRDLDIEAVHVVRDARAVANSWLREREREDRVPPAPMPVRSPLRAALQWYANLAAELFSEGDLHRVHYEEFARDPQKVLRTLLDTLGYDGALLPGSLTDGRVELTRQHNVAGNPMRMAAGHTTVRADEAWRREMPTRARWAVTATAAPLLAHYGYRLR